LVNNGFIKEVMKGWYIPTRPDEPVGESTSWYASFWKFLSGYLKSKFGNQWYLSPEQSLSIHSENWSVPAQLLVCSPKGGNKPIFLLHDTSIMNVRLKLPDKDDLVVPVENLDHRQITKEIRSCFH